MALPCFPYNFFFFEFGINFLILLFLRILSSTRKGHIIVDFILSRDFFFFFSRKKNFFSDILRAAEIFFFFHFAGRFIAEYYSRCWRSRVGSSNMTAYYLNSLISARGLSDICKRAL